MNGAAEMPVSPTNYVDPTESNVSMAEGCLRYGIKRIQTESYSNRIRDLVVPDGIVAIDAHAYRGRIGRVFIPESMESIAPEAFCTADVIELFDAGCLNGTDIPRMTVNIAAGQGVAGGTNDVEYVVRVPETFEVLFRVWAPYAHMSTRQMIEDFEHAWRADMTFDFGVIDTYFDQLNGESPHYDTNDKLWSAINRLRWPISLDQSTAAKYCEYVKRFAFDALEELVKEDDADRFSVLLECGALTKATLHDMRDMALVAGAQEITSMIDAAPKRAAAENEPVSKHHILAQVANALDVGDVSKLEKLAPVASRLRPKDRVALLEHAAAGCKAKAFQQVYDALAPFEYTSRALLVALFSGNTSAARMLIEHGANLEGNLEGEECCRFRKECQYSHGLIYQLPAKQILLLRRDRPQVLHCRVEMAGNLRHALTKDTGEVESMAACEDDAGQVFQPTVNTSSRARAARTLIAIARKTPCNKSIAIALLWHFISFDGCDCNLKYDYLHDEPFRYHFDCKNARKVLESGILPSEDITQLPWKTAIDPLLESIRPSYKELKLVKDFASPEVFAACWQPKFMDYDERSYGTYMEYMLLFVDVIPGIRYPALKSAVKANDLEHLKELSKIEGVLTKRRIKMLIGISSEAGNLETTAWLLEQYNKS